MAINQPREKGIDEETCKKLTGLFISHPPVIDIFENELHFHENSLTIFMVTAVVKKKDKIKNLCLGIMKKFVDRNQQTFSREKISSAFKMVFECAKRLADKNFINACTDLVVLKDQMPGLNYSLTSSWKTIFDIPDVLTSATTHNSKYKLQEYKDFDNPASVSEVPLGKINLSAPTTVVPPVDMSLKRQVESMVTRAYHPSGGS